MSRINKADVASKWCILRTSGARTLALADSLTAAGIEAWTPSQVKRRRVPRQKAYVFTSYPILPTFVFARGQHVLELYRLAMQPVKAHPDYSLLRQGLEVPLIREAAVLGLRQVEADMQAVLDGEVTKQQREAMRAHRRDFDINAEVHTDVGGFKGMTGIVKDSNGKWAWVIFGGRMKVKVDAFLLRTGAVQTASPELGTAA